MNIKLLTNSLLLVLLLLSGCVLQNSKDYTLLVNPFIGTGADGNTWPGASMPFGGVQLSPDTRLNSCGGYAYSDSTIIGFSHTHLSGVGEPEYRDVLFMPTVGEFSLSPGEKGYGSSFSHDEEIATPGFYSVRLKDADILAELTTTMRSGFQRYTFPESEDAHIIIDLAYPFGAEDLYLKKVSDTEIEGMRRSHGWAWDQYVYFVAKFSKPFSSFSIAVNDSLKENLGETRGKNLKAVVNYKTKTGEKILVKVGISAVSAEGARKNLDAEIPDWDFDNVKANAKEAWNKELAKIEIEGGTPEQQSVFYTSMYHACLSPDIYMDVDGKYRGIDHRVHETNGFTNYTVFSIWDTYRALHPLFTIIDQKRTTDFVRSLLQKYDDGGRLPMWPLAGNYTDDMLGYHAVSVIADAYMKGIRNYDTEKAFSAMKELAEMDRLGLKYYKKIGYLPYERQGESVSKTLEYCYDDWCIAQMAKAMNKTEDYNEFHQRAHNWENVFDQEVGFMRGKSYGREWLEPFDPLKNSAYSEGNAYQYMYVPHDVNGLSEKMGGEKAFSEWLDVLFSLKDKKGQRGIIGQYWHGNEPSQQLAFLYNYVGEAWKTQKLANQILNELYSTENDGLAGNDDCGQISAWYIFSSMGFYPVAPGQPMYVIGSPLFSKATIHLENGKTFVVKAHNVSKENIYIQSASLNGKEYPNSYLHHQDIMNGGELVFEMGAKPNTSWGALSENRPYSENGNLVVSLPYIQSGDTLFEKTTVVTLACETKDALIYYTLDGTEPSEKSGLYSKPVAVSESCVLKMKAFKKEMDASTTVIYPFKKADYSPSQKITNVSPGIAFNYYERFFVTTEDLDKVAPVFSGVTDKIDLTPAVKHSYYGLKFNGWIKVPVDGIYAFFLKSNDGSRLFIDDIQLIENDANHGSVVEPGEIALEAGYHKIVVNYMQCGGGKSLQLSWAGPGFEQRQIGKKELFWKQ